ncbi:MAG: HAD family hydrolase [Oscillospiraceae bacterium]|nr:HAD family hydrolase [Oscillospiraceae bacterium]
MNYKLAIFDLDGTILDTLEDLTDGVNYALSECGYPVRTIAEVRRFVGNGIRKLIERALPAGTPEAEIDRVHGIFSPYYKAHCDVKTKPYDGIPEMLQALRAAGMETAVLSNKGDFAVQPLIRHYFPDLFTLAFGERPGIPRKPAPDAVFEILERLGTDKADAVYIGDSNVDIETARNAGLSCICVDWGFRDRAQLIEDGAERIVSTPEALRKALLGT